MLRFFSVENSRQLTLAFALCCVPSIGMAQDEQASDEGCLAFMAEQESGLRANQIARCLNETVAQIRDELAGEARRIAGTEVSDAEARLLASLPITQIQTGAINLDSTQNPDLLQDSRNENGECMEGERAYRGDVRRRETFDVAFEQPPAVILGLTHIVANTGNANFRLNAVVHDVDEEGFTYSFFTWCNTHIWRANINWAAIGQQIIALPAE